MTHIGLEDGGDEAGAESVGAWLDRARPRPDLPPEVLATQLVVDRLLRASPLPRRSPPMSRDENEAIWEALRLELGLDDGTMVRRALRWLRPGVRR